MSDKELRRLVLRDQVATLDTNYVGQEGRGAARCMLNKTLELLDKQWAVEDAEDAQREALIAGLRAEVHAAVEGIPGLSTPDRVDYVSDHIAGYLSTFVLRVDSGTWEEPA